MKQGYSEAMTISDHWACCFCGETTTDDDVITLIALAGVRKPIVQLGAHGSCLEGLVIEAARPLSWDFATPPDEE